jgi:lipopolysaccharide transport system ATP-binding protein
MAKPAIRVEGLWKEYVIGAQQKAHSTFYDMLSSSLAAPFRALRKRTAEQQAAESFWALRDVNFEVQPGEVVGIIGRNGAGKSTLLKTLSRITAPTRGQVECRGRLASLLEVGTGFHPELSGRENIFLNGAILGMARAEVARKFDEIVAFAEIDKFVDTPVKRYSSGMYVRLAFAVAAHLEPDILIVDEVLAVGDAVFQKKCLGKMEDVSKRQGRTVVFVSHNMAMISSLCQHGLLLDQGQLVVQGTASEVVLAYGGRAQGAASSSASVEYEDSGRTVGNSVAQLLSGAVCNSAGVPSAEIDIAESVLVRMVYRITAAIDLQLVPNFHFYRSDGNCAFVTSGGDARTLSPGVYKAQCHIPANFLNDGLYSVGLALSSFEPSLEVHFNEQGALIFNIRDPLDGVLTRAGYRGPVPGAIRPLLKWSVEPLHKRD